MSDSVQKSYSLKHFRAQCGDCPGAPDDTTLAPLFEIAWKNVLEKEFQERRLAQFGITDVFFLDKAGHFGRGEWICVVDKLMVWVTPISTDMDYDSSGHSIYMTWRINVRGDNQRVNSLIIQIASFFKKYLAGKTFQMLHAEGASSLKKYPPNILSKEVRRFYNLGN